MDDLICVSLPYEGCPDLEVRALENELPLGVTGDGRNWSFLGQVFEIGRGVRTADDEKTLLEGPVFIGHGQQASHMLKLGQILLDYARQQQMAIA